MPDFYLICVFPDSATRKQIANALGSPDGLCVDGRLVIKHLLAANALSAEGLAASVVGDAEGVKAGSEALAEG